MSTQFPAGTSDITTLADDDSFLVADNSDSDAIKKTNIAEIKTAISTETPTAGKIPRAGDDGRIALGWLPGVTGCTWDQVNDVYSGNPAAQTVHTNMRRCVINSSGEVQYYLNAYDSTLKEDGVTASVLDGTDGQVVVEILPVYCKTTWEGDVVTWEVSDTADAGFVLHPAFEDGAVSKIYIGAYDASVKDVSAGIYIGGLNLDDNTSRVDTTTDLIASVSGQYPMVGLTRAEFRTLAENAGYQLYDFWQHQLVQLLYLTEYGDWNSQEMLGEGNVNGTYVDSSDIQSDSPHTIAGTSNSLGNQSGHVNSADGTPFVSYRGIENPFGNCYQWLDGFNINDRQIYVNNDETTFADDTATNYTLLGAVLPSTNGYIKQIQKLDNIIIAATVGASSGSFVTDYLYTATGWRVASAGGRANCGLAAGLAFLRLHYSSANRFRYFGARLSKKIRE